MRRLLLAAGWIAMANLGCNRPTAEGPSKFPTKTITIICPWATGGGTDRVSRAMADGLQREFSKPCVVVNKTGGAGAIGHQAGASARPDGYTLTMITFELATMHHMGICPLTCDDFVPLLQINSDAAAIIVQRDSPWKNIGEFLETAKSSPGKIKMSGTAAGGAWDLARIGMQRAAGIPVEAVTWVPTQGSAPAIVDLLGGHIDAVCCSIPEVATQLEAGQLRALAVMAETRLEGLPDVPTLKEGSVDWIAIGWRGLAVPLETPPAIVQQLTAACRRVTESDDFLAQMKKFGFGVFVRETDQFAEFLRQQDQLWQPIVQVSGYARQ